MYRAHVGCHSDVCGASPCGACDVLELLRGALSLRLGDGACGVRVPYAREALRGAHDDALCLHGVL